MILVTCKACNDAKEDCEKSESIRRWCPPTDDCEKSESMRRWDLLFPLGGRCSFPEGGNEVGASEKSLLAVRRWRCPFFLPSGVPGIFVFFLLLREGLVSMDDKDTVLGVPVMLGAKDKDPISSGEKLSSRCFLAPVSGDLTHMVP